MTKKKKGKVTISKNLQKKSFFIGKDGKPQEVKSAIDGLRKSKRR